MGQRRAQVHAVQQELLKEGASIRPCTGYELPKFLRVTVGSEA